MSDRSRERAEDLNCREKWDFSELQCPRCGKRMEYLTSDLEGGSILSGVHCVTNLHCNPDRGGSCGLALNLAGRR
jgi:hypothetical protein